MSCSAAQINDQIVQQGDKVRKLKADKAAKSDVDAAVKCLLELKTKFKEATGQDWKPGVAVAEPAASAKSATSTESINAKIVEQGNLVRELKTKKAPKADVDGAVKVLLDLKAQYKSATGKDWKPEATPAPAATAVPAKKEVPQASASASDINEKIVKQGDVVRDLKSKKAAKAEVEAQVKVLLDLKSQYKASTGQDWKPGCVPPAESKTSVQAPSGGNSEVELLEKITAQGDKVRTLKTNKADKATVDAAVKALLQLKADYKTLTGKDWKPGTVSAAAPVSTQNKENMAPTNEVASGGSDKDALTAKVNAQGETVRNLKSSGASKDQVDAAVKVLLDLKAEYKKLTGTDFPVAGRTPKPAAPKKEAKKEEKPKAKPEPAKLKEDGSGPKKQTRLGLEATKEDNLPDWYSQVITKGEMIEYYDVSGCYILRHWSFAIWKAIKAWFDGEITRMGVKECYFPIFVSKAALEREKSHIADFAPEVAWVTKSGESDLAEPIAVRPTSETVMYPAYAKWIQSYRDLPIRLNQWNNVVVCMAGVFLFKPMSHILFNFTAMGIQTSAAILAYP